MLSCDGDQAVVPIDVADDQTGDLGHPCREEGGEEDKVSVSRLHPVIDRECGAHRLLYCVSGVDGIENRLPRNPEPYCATAVIVTIIAQMYTHAAIQA